MKKQIPKIIWTIILAMFVFHGVMEDTIAVWKIFDECIALSCFPLALWHYFSTRENVATKGARCRRMQLFFLVAFVLCGVAGNLLFKYQPIGIAAISAVLSTKFFMILLTAGYLQKLLKIDLEEMEVPVQVLSFLWFGYYVISLSSTNTFTQVEAWDICAKSTVLAALLIFCVKKRVWTYRIGLVLMVFMLVYSGKEKAYGAMLLFVCLYYLVVRKKIRTKIQYILMIAIPIVVMAWDKIYLYYIQGSGIYPKSVMTSVSLQIAKDYFPIGTGFGTFGSTYAASYYSPVYYLYGIAEHPALGPESRQYLKDVFWPILFGETGVLGTILYCGLMVTLLVQIQRVFYYNRKKYMLLIFMYMYMLMTTFTETGFMQPMVMVFAFVMGTLLEEYEEKRTHKLRFFKEKE